LKEKIQSLFKDVWNVPNVLTMIRMALIPVFVAFFFAGHPKYALAVFCVASFTDFLDGFIARKHNLITDFGKLFDPLADKLMVLTALFCQGIAGVFPWVAIFIVLAKEILMMIGGVIMLGHGVVVYANYFGKTAQVCFIISLILSFFHAELAAWGYPLDLWLLCLTVFLSILAMIVYAAAAWKVLRAPKEKNEENPEE